MKVSLRTQMVISFSAIYILLIILFGGLVLNYNISSYQKQSYDYIYKVVKANIRLADNYFEQLSNVSQIIANDSGIIRAVSYRNSVDMIDYSVELYNQRDVAAKIKQLDVIGDISNALIIGVNNEYLYYYGSSPVKGYNFNKQEWFNKAIADNKYIRFTNFHPTDYLLNDKHQETVSIITPILSLNPYSSNKLSYLMCDFNLRPIISDENELGSAQIAIFDGTNPVKFFGSSYLSDTQQQQVVEALEEKKKYFILPKSKDNPVSLLVVNEMSEMSGWSMLGIMPLTEIEQMRTMNTSFVIMMIIIACILVLISAVIISRSIMIPMHGLIKNFKRIASGNQKVVFKPSKSIEINAIARTAEYMLLNINQLTSEIVEKQKNLSMEQLKVLQNQINPHFLNNVLQSIKAMAVSGDTKSISRMTTLLGKVLSYSVYNPYEKVTLREELDYTENYISIQNIRFNQLITYNIDCEDQLQQIYVPKLIIQPLIENAIEHGFSSCEEGHISIETEDAGNEFYILVTNNGSILNADEIVSLNEMLSNEDAYKKKYSIGLLNVNLRLKSSFGPQAGLKIFSREGMKTIVVITIPK